MLTRRSLITGGVLTGAVAGGGAAATGPTGDPGQSSRGGSSNADEQIARVLEDIRDLVRGASGGNSAELTNIRALQRDFLKSHGKFPDFIEIGIDVWDALMSWHVRTRQQPQVTRMADGRYSMAVFQTNLILRHDVSNAYIGPAFDAK
jgi:hypothetical protein